MPKGPEVRGGVPKIFQGGGRYFQPLGGVPKHQPGGGDGGGQSPKKISGRLRRPKIPDFAAFGGKIWLGGGLEYINFPPVVFRLWGGMVFRVESLNPPQ